MLKFIYVLTILYYKVFLYVPNSFFDFKYIM